MPDPISAVAGGAVFSGILGADAAGDAADAQSASSAAGIGEQRRQFDAMQKLLQPYVQQGTQAIGGMQPFANAGAPALAQQQALLGMNGAGAQRGAIDSIANSPLLQQLMKQGEQGILQNASATGGLRGGNLQGALAQFRPAMLQQAIDQQYSRLGGMTALGQMTNQNLAQLGQASAGGVGAAGMNSANSISGLMQQQGAAQAGAGLAQANAMSNAIGGLGGMYSSGAFSKFGGGGGIQLGGVNPTSGEFMGSLEF